MDPAVFQWTAICLCVAQSAVFSGLNLALFGVSRLELEIEVGQGNKRAERILALRKDSNFLLTTILWGNVATNVLLALVIDSAMTGLVGFLFSTVVITVCGEIMPQAFSRAMQCVWVPCCHPCCVLISTFYFPWPSRLLGLWISCWAKKAFSISRKYIYVI